ncbi:solute carrier family 22 member 15-like isoform X2 [Montipora foliosa]
MPDVGEKSNQEDFEQFANRTRYGGINRVPMPKTQGFFFEFDDILKFIGEFGSRQSNLFFITCVFVNIPCAFQLISLYFINGTPKFQCVTPSASAICDVDKCCKNCSKYEFTENFTSTTTEYNLICDRAYIAASMQAGFMAGMVVGSSLFGAVSDSYGRRFCMFLCGFLTFVFSIGAAYTHSLILFTVLRVATAASLTGLMYAQYVYTLEIVGASYRTLVAQTSALFWVIGNLGLALLAYYIREWRTLLLIISCPPVLLIFLWRFVPESPRWLVAQGRTDEAARVLTKFCDNSSRSVNLSGWLKSALEHCQLGQTGEEGKKSRYSPIDLVRTPRLRKRTIIFWFCWMVQCMVIYGFLFNLSDLAGNPYMNVLWTYGGDAVGVFLGWITIQKFGRRIPCCIFMIVGGVACLAVVAVPKNKQVVSTALAIIGRFLISLTFSVMWLYVSELYPTSIRNLALGSCSTFARFGSMVSPYVVMMSQLPGLSVTLPMMIFGVLSVIAGVMVLWLPETLDANMCQTIEEVAVAEEYYGFVWMGKRVARPCSYFRSPVVEANSSQNLPEDQEFVNENSPLI